MMGDNNPPEALRRDNAVQTTYLLKFISYTPALYLVLLCIQEENLTSNFRNVINLD